jgi:hypothetical protein
VNGEHLGLNNRKLKIWAAVNISLHLLFTCNIAN